jgi:hypothetical protein
MRRSTIVFVLLFVVAAGVYYFLSNREEPADITLTLEPEDVVTYLFSADEGVPAGIRIESKDGAMVEVARDADNAWALIQPFEAAANSGSVEAAASQITTMRVLDTLPDVDLDVVGLKNPEYELTVKFAGVERNVSIGVITPTGTGYYALNQDGEVVIVSASAVDGLLNLLNNPPYLETPTPSPTATETPLPTPTPEPFDVTQGTPATPATAAPQP